MAQHASEIYVHNFGATGHTNVNITHLIDEHEASGKGVIPRTDLIVGGFPCQDYSVAKTLNSSRGLEGKKGVLWWDIHRLVKSNKPQFVFLENVDRLLKSPATQRGRDFAIMLKTLGDLGYLIEWRAVNAAEYGFPQRRIRVFIVATKMNAKKPLTIASSSERILRTGILARALPVKEPDSPLKRIDLADPVDVISKSFNQGDERSPFLNSGVYFANTAFTIRTEPKRPRSARVLGDVLVNDDRVEDEFWVPVNRFAEWEYLKGAKSIERKHKASGTAYHYAEGRMAFPDLLTNPSRTVLTGEGGTSPSRFKHIIKRPRGYRRLVPVELERLNGFPDNWTQTNGNSTIGDARRAFIMGNALVIGLIAKVGEVLAQEIQESNRA